MLSKTSLHLFWRVLTFLDLESHGSSENNKIGVGFDMIRGVRGGYMARVIYQMKGKKMMNKMVVVVLLWSRRCDGGGEMRVAARLRKKKKMRDGVVLLFFFLWCENAAITRTIY